MRYHNHVSLGLVAVDGMKELVREYDSHTGDALLRIAANVMRNSIRESDIPARYTSERFAIIFPTTSARAGGTSGRNSASGCAAAWTCWAIFCAAPSPSNGTRPLIR